MKRFLFLTAFLTLGCLISSAQQFNITMVLNPPTGGCGNPLAFELALSNNTMYSCQAGTWQIFPSGGSGGNPPFSSITSGSNTGHNFVMGNGATLSSTGTGQIYANLLNRYAFALLPAPSSAINQIALVTDSLSVPCSSSDSFCYSSGGNWFRISTPNSGSLPFGSLLSGTNTSAIMHLGTGATLDSTGGILNANQILGNPVPANASGVLTNNGSGVLSWQPSSAAFSALTSGTNTSMAALIGTGASLGYSGGGTVSANLLLNNPVPANASGCLSNNGSGVLSWGTCTGGGGSGTVNAGSAGQLGYYATNSTTISGLSLGGSGALSLGTGSLDVVTSVVPLLYNSPTITGTWLYSHQFQMTAAANGATPATGNYTYYTNSGDGLLHQVNSSGTDVPIGSGSGSAVTASVIASFPSAGANTNKLYRGTDALNPQDCSVGGINTKPSTSLCVSNGTSWVPVDTLGDAPVFPTYAVDSNSPVWAEWYKGAVAQATTRVVNVIIYGDSISICWSSFCGGAGDGPGANDKAHRWVDMFRQTIRNAGLSHGTGMVPVAQRITNSGIGNDSTVWALSGSIAQDATLGPNQTGASVPSSNGSALLKFATSATATWTDPEAYDHLLVYCMTGPATTGFSVTIDTVSAGNVCTSTPGSNTATVSASVNAVFYGPHTVVLTALGNTSYLYAAQGTTGTTGIDVHNLSTASAACEYYDSNTGGHSTARTAFTDLFTQHDLDVYPIGVNESGNLFTTTQFGTCLQNLISHNATLGAPSQLVMNEHHFYTEAFGTNVSFANYWATANSVAQANGAGYMTVSDRWGTFFQANGNTNSLSGTFKMYTDGIHENTVGAREYFKMFLHKLTNADDVPTGFSPGFVSTFNVGKSNSSQSFNFGSDQFAIMRVTDNNTNTSVGAPSGEAGYEATTNAGTVGWYTWDKGNGALLPGAFIMQGTDTNLKQFRTPVGTSAAVSGMWFGNALNPALSSGIAFGLLDTGHLFAGASGALSISGCGSGATLDANATDLSGILTVGTSPGSCVVTFAAAYPVKPHVTVSEEGANPIHYLPSTTGITFTSLSAGWVIHYRADY